MAGFAESYLGRLRQVAGSRLILVPGARVVVLNANGKVLLQRRADFGVWGLPGGNAEEGEDLATVAIREVEEETGLRVAGLKPFGFGCDPAIETVVFPNGDQCQFFVLNFVATAVSGLPRVGDEESLALGWFAPGTLPEMLPNMRRSLDAYRRFVVTGEFQMI